MSLAFQIQNRIDELLRDAARNTSEEQKIAASLNALPIYPDWSGFIAICPDGSFLYRGEDGTVEQYVEPEWQLIALISGSKKYPELASLLPERPANANGCGDCNGTGRGIFEGRQLDNVYCGKCFGLGWVDEYIKALSEEARTRIAATINDA